MSLRDEFPTLVLLVLCYVAFLLLTGFAGTIGPVAVFLGLCVLVTLHSSLQHEVLHGHPFRSSFLNDATVFLALGLFIPYLRFKDTHLAHHNDPVLTDPYDDPETNFLSARDWQALPKAVQQVRVFNNILLGRMVIGPFISLACLYRQDVMAMARGEGRIWLSYGLHSIGVMPVLYVIARSDVSFWLYAAAAYSGLSILKIRTFLEHRAHVRASARSVIIEDRGPLAFLFLNNNYHAVHHARPKVVWHKLPAVFDAHRDMYLQRNDGYVYPSYMFVISRYLFLAKDPVVHPHWTACDKSNATSSDD